MSFFQYVSVPSIYLSALRFVYDCFGLYDVRNPSAVRPMVEINLSQVSIDTTTTTGANAANAYKLVKK